MSDDLKTDSLHDQAERERRVIRALERLEKDWPDNLTLASMGGSLHLMRTDQMHEWPEGILPQHRGLNPDASLWSSTRIPNTGGDW